MHLLITQALSAHKERVNHKISLYQTVLILRHSESGLTRQ